MNPFLIEHSEEELRLTTEFQRQVAALAAVTLKSFSARRADKEPEAEKGLQLDLKHQARHCGVADGNACFDVSMTMDALADGDPDKLLFHIECVFELVCELDENFAPSEEQLTAYQKGNAVFACWPYVREFVQNATSRLGLSVPPFRYFGSFTSPMQPNRSSLPARRQSGARWCNATLANGIPERSYNTVTELRD